MRFFNLLTLAPLLLSLPAVNAQTPDGLLVPFSTLPACAADCGTLWDVQGACIPPVFASADKACFCGDARLSPLSAGDSSPCALAGCAAGAAGIGGIQEWYRGFCGAANAVPPGGGAGTPTQTPNPNQPAQPVAPVETTQPDGSVVTVTPAPNPTSTDGAVRNPVKQSWIEGHYQYIIMIVILVLAIILGWIAACFFRRRYLKKRELGFELRPPHQPWVGTNDNTGPYGAYDPSKEGMIAEEAKPKKKWIVHTRT